MRLYFTLKSVPELADLSPRERYRAWFACVRHSPRSLKTRASLFLCFAPWLLPFIHPVWWLFCIVSPILMVPAILNFNRLQVEELRPFFRDYRDRIGLTTDCS